MSPCVYHKFARMVAASRPRPTPCATIAITPSTRLRTTCAKPHMQPNGCVCLLMASPIPPTTPASPWLRVLTGLLTLTRVRNRLCAAPSSAHRPSTSLAHSSPTPPLRTQPQIRTHALAARSPMHAQRRRAPEPYKDRSILQRVSDNRNFKTHGVQNIFKIVAMPPRARRTLRHDWK